MLRFLSCVFVAALGFNQSGSAQDGPQPRYVDPGKPGEAPSDAVVLFSGKDMSEWVHEDGRPAQWLAQNGIIICKSGSGDIFPNHKFSNAQIHVQFSTPSLPNFKTHPPR